MSQKPGHHIATLKMIQKRLESTSDKNIKFGYKGPQTLLKHSKQTKLLILFKDVINGMIFIAENEIAVNLI